MHRPIHLMLILVLAIVAACSDDPQPATLDTLDTEPDLSTLDPDATQDAADAPDDLPPETLPPTLPPCLRLCDRFLDCPEGCPGLDWRTTLLAYPLCLERCPALPAEDLLQATCAEIQAALFAQSPPLRDLCEQPFCHSHCHYFAHCLVEQCPGFIPAQLAPLAEDCLRGCDPDDRGALFTMTCEDITTFLNQDPYFHLLCTSSPECADAPQCALYADKISTCLQQRCAPNADPFLDGLREILTHNCLQPESCPRQAEVLWLTTSACDAPPLDTLGQEPTLSHLCTGLLTPHLDALDAACARATACAFPLPPLHTCRTLLALHPDPLALLTCFDAAQSCQEIAACL